MNRRNTCKYCGFADFASKLEITRHNMSILYIINEKGCITNTALIIDSLVFIMTFAGQYFEYTGIDTIYQAVTVINTAAPESGIIPL